MFYAGISCRQRKEDRVVLDKKTMKWNKQEGGEMTMHLENSERMDKN
jgi:hypothetical protein